VFVGLVLASASRAEAPPEVTRLDQAKTLFREGVVLLQESEPERALDRFLRSRALVPSAKNTINAGICLERLGRFDEALELYEDASARFAQELDERDRRSLDLVLADLRRRVGRLELTANVEAAVKIDGRPRGFLPRAAPLPLLPGVRALHLSAEGRVPFERIVEIREGELSSLRARLDEIPHVRTPDTISEKRLGSPSTAARGNASPWWLELVLEGGLIYAPGFRGEPERNCPAQCNGQPNAWGGRGVAMIGFHHRTSIGAELGLGYAVLGEDFARGSFGDSLYVVEQHISASGPVVEFGALFEPRIFGQTSLSAGVGAGLFFASYVNRITGVAGGNPPQIPLRAAEDLDASEIAPFIAASLGIAGALGSFRLRGSFGLWFLPTDGPKAEGPELEPDCESAAATCPPNSQALVGEKLRGPGYWLTPELGVGYVF
jgi:hypothetical protein